MYSYLFPFNNLFKKEKPKISRYRKTKKAWKYKSYLLMEIKFWTLKSKIASSNIPAFPSQSFGKLIQQLEHDRAAGAFDVNGDPASRPFSISPRVEAQRIVDQKRPTLRLHLAS